MMRWIWLFLLFCVACSNKPTTAPPPAVSLETSTEVLRALKGVKTVASGITGNQQTAFEVTKRTGEMTQYPCNACHQEAVVVKDQSERWSHLDMQLLHGQNVGMDCQTCHDYSNLQQLRLQNGTAVSFDHSYQVCQQCHFEQARDWAGGAHGKRLVGWQGKRVVMACMDCHNPHRPAFDQRIPFKGPSIPRNGTH